jgi:hypothetical protein
LLEFGGIHGSSKLKIKTLQTRINNSKASYSQAFEDI